MNITHGGKRPGSGAKSKESKGQKRFSRITFTAPPQLEAQIHDSIPDGSTLSEFIRLLIAYGLKKYS